MIKESIIMNPRQFRSLILISYLLSVLFIGYQSQVTKQSTEAIVDVIFSPDGRFIATTSIDKRLIIWDAAQCNETRTIELELVPSNLVYSPDGNFIASGDARGTISIWDADTGAFIKSLTGQTSVITSLDYSPDGRMLVSTSYDSPKIFVWDIEKGRFIRRLDMSIAPDDALRQKGASFSPDGQFIAAANGESIDIWNSSTGAHLHLLEKPMHFPQKISYSPNGQTLVSSGSGEIAVVLWDAATGRELKLVSDAYLFRRIEAYSPDGHYILSRYSHWLEIWNAWTLEWVSDLGENRYQLTSAAYSPNGRYIVSSSMDGQAAIWDAITLESICRLGNPTAANP
jgi:WD40 repeat protein